jgi:hypothetical protein
MQVRKRALGKSGKCVDQWEGRYKKFKRYLCIYIESSKAAYELKGI